MIVTLEVHPRSLWQGLVGVVWIVRVVRVASWGLFLRRGDGAPVCAWVGERRRTVVGHGRPL